MQPDINLAVKALKNAQKSPSWMSPEEIKIFVQQCIADALVALCQANPLNPPVAHPDYDRFTSNETDS